jgi:hypothetical protein
MSDKFLQALWGVVIYFETFSQFERAEEQDASREMLFLGCSTSLSVIGLYGVEAWMIGER